MGAETPTIPVGLDAYRQWDNWAVQRIGVRAYMRSTYDRKGGNERADASHYLYQLSEDKNVTLDVAGNGVLYFAPVLAGRLEGLTFPMQVHGTPIRVTLRDSTLTVVITGGFSRAIKVGIGDDVRELGAGERCTFKLTGAVAPAVHASDTQGSR